MEHKAALSARFLQSLVGTESKGGLTLITWIGISCAVDQHLGKDLHIRTGGHILDQSTDI